MKQSRFVVQGEEEAQGQVPEAHQLLEIRKWKRCSRRGGEDVARIWEERTKSMLYCGSQVETTFQKEDKIMSSKIKSTNFPLDLAKLESLGTLRKTVSMKRVSSVYCQHWIILYKLLSKDWPLISFNCLWIKATHLIYMNIFFFV